jgi:ribosome biogenesis protein Nip4
VIEPIKGFASKVNAKLEIKPKLLFEKEGRFFLLSDEIKSIMRIDFFYAGSYLGKVKKGKFFPSFILLAILASGRANKVIVKEKAAWLFVCGRDILNEGIKEVRGSRRKGDFTLVLNVFEECLGFGRIVHDLNSTEAGVAVQNVSDLGDFLRRERLRAPNR